ncbi:MAG: 2OG-Fe(II) oxygenase [Myxococcota bacterium]
MTDLFSDAMTKRLLALGEELASKYQGNSPFPHIVIDDFLPADALERVVEDYPAPEQLPWIQFDKPQEKKLAFNDLAQIPSSIRDVLQFMNSPTMLRFLEHVSGIPNLMADPYLLGGGLHQIRRGGFLGIHVDFNKYARFDLDRRLNMLIYLNKDWREEYGGHLELWDERMEKCEQRVLPVFNRCVVFSTTEISYHGHPDPLTCPEHRARRSLATYYYTNGRPESERAGKHTTIFRNRMGVGETPVRGPAELARRALEAVTPPIVLSAMRKLRGR